MALPMVFVLPSAEKEIQSFVDPSAIDLAKERLREIEEFGILRLLSSETAQRTGRGASSLDEIKIKGRKMEFRIFGSEVPKNIYAVLHAFAKKSRKIKKKNIDLAIKRKKEAIYEISKL